MFIDKAHIFVRGGKGGDGSVSFRREKYVPRGGPDGGDGGRGGDVFLEASSHLRTLLDFVRRSHFEAEKGYPGMGRKKSGKSGCDLTLSIPCGTAIYQDGTLLADLVQPGEKVLVARGGRGGRGNNHFKSSVRQAPRISERGEPAEEKDIELQLKVIADVGLIGCPNAGKSTLLSRLTRANPKIANYPFTTLYPNLGVALTRDQEIVLADIPGLIAGSHQGKGLGHEFLRHVERTRILIHVVDPLGYAGRSPKDNIKIIERELRNYSSVVSKKPQILIINKQDLTDADKVYKQIRRSYRSRRVMATSGVSGEGLDAVIAEIAKALQDLPDEAGETPASSGRIHLEPEFWVEKASSHFVVRGKRVERLVGMTNFDWDQAVERTQHILKKIGVEKQLLAAGATAGDLVHIAGFEFTFQPDRPVPSSMLR